MKHLPNDILYGFDKTFNENNAWRNIPSAISSYCKRLGIQLYAVEPRWIKSLYKKVEFYEYRVFETTPQTVSSSLLKTGLLIDFLKEYKITYSLVNYDKFQNDKCIGPFSRAYQEFVKSNTYKVLTKQVEVTLSKNNMEFLKGERYIFPNTVCLVYPIKVPNHIHEIIHIFYNDLLESLPNTHTLQYDSRLFVPDNTIIDSWSIRIKDEQIPFVKHFRDCTIWSDGELPINEASSNIDKMYKSFDIQIDDNGDILISQKEYDSFDKHFNTTKRLLKNYHKSKNYNGMKNELYKLSYMIKLIEVYHMGKTSSEEERLKQKELLDLRSVMINSFSYYIDIVIKEEPDFDFQSGFDNSKYGKTYKLNVLGASRLARKLISIFI